MDRRKMGAVLACSYGLLLNNLTPPELEQLKDEIKADIMKEITSELPVQITNGLKSNTTRHIIAEIVKQISSDTHIAFMAALSNSITNPSNGQHIIFDKVQVNDGGCYNSRHGIFLASVSGLYTFTLNIASQHQSTSHSLHLNMMVRDKPMGYIFLDGNTQFWFRRSDTIVVHLNKGDDVWVKAFDVTGTVVINGDIGSYLHSHLSGFLIRKD